MKRFITFLLMFFLIIAVSFAADKFFIKEKYIKKTGAQVFGLVITYKFNDEGYNDYLIWKDKTRGKWGYLLQEDLVERRGEWTFVRSMATGTVIRYEQILTVYHLFAFVDTAQDYWVYAHNNVISRQVKVVALGNEVEDFAIVKFVSPQGYEGLKIAKKDLKIGEKIMWIGNGDCIAFNERYGYTGDLTHYFDRHRDLQLVHWIDSPFVSMNPVARGDSGTALVNEKGQIAGVIYLGFFTDQFALGASQSLTNLRKFLDSNNIEY